MTTSLAPGTAGRPTFGIRLPNSGPFALSESLLTVAASADAGGYDALWVHDHISWGRNMLTHFAAGTIEGCTDQDPNFYESLSTISFLAGRHPRLHVGVAGLVLPIRDPRLLAKQLSTLDNLSGGRAVVAAAIGNIPNDFSVVGVPYKRRARITEEYLQVLRAALGASDAIEFEGEFVSFTDGTFLPRPVRLPLWLAGSSEPGLGRAVRYGDGWMTVYQSIEGYADLSGRLTELAEEADRDPASLTRAYETYVSVADTEQEALANAQASMLHSFKSVERGLDVCLIGTADTIVERIARYRAVGVDHFELKFYCRSIAHMTDQLGMLSEVLGLRQHATV